MTGYASATAGLGAAPETGTSTEAISARSGTSPAASVTIELRSVNGRFLDLNFRLPDEFRSLEPALRDLLAAALRRGKVELRLNARTESDDAWPVPQHDQLNRLGRIESTVQSWLPKAKSLSVHEVMQWCKGGALVERLDEVALDAAKRAITGLSEAREREGERLVAVLMERVKRLRELAAQVEPLVPSRSAPAAEVSRALARGARNHRRRANHRPRDPA